MIIGKTSSNMSKVEVFSRISEIEVLTTVFPEVRTLPCLICSPIRQDRNPSFGLYLSESNHVYYKDFATNERGGLLDLLCRYWRCSFRHALDKICDMFISNQEITIKPKQIKTFTRKEASSLTQIQVVVRPWKDYDFEYWESYGVERKWLRYAEVYPISHKIVTKMESPTSKGIKYIFNADKYAYCFVERKEGNVSLKIYQPFNKQGFKWCSKMDSSVIGLWSKIPETGDRVIICSSLKDALCISCQLHIPTLCLQGEGYSMSNTAIRELKQRYKRIFIAFDTDIPGIMDGKKLAKQTGFIHVIPNLGKEKDFSDYYKALDNKEDFKKLREYFL